MTSLEYFQCFECHKLGSSSWLQEHLKRHEAEYSFKREGPNRRVTFAKVTFPNCFIPLVRTKLSSSPDTRSVKRESRSASTENGGSENTVFSRKSRLIMSTEKVPESPDTPDEGSTKQPLQSIFKTDESAKKPYKILVVPPREDLQKCEYCPESKHFESKSALNRHLLLTHWAQATMIICPVPTCHQQFPADAVNFRLHITFHSLAEENENDVLQTRSSGKVVGEFYNERLDSPSNSNDSCSSDDDENPESLVTRKRKTAIRVDDLHICKFCLSRWDSRTDLRLHLKERHGSLQDGWNCPFCQDDNPIPKFQTILTFIVHVSELHREVMNPLNEKGNEFAISRPCPESHSSQAPLLSPNNAGNGFETSSATVLTEEDNNQQIVTQNTPLGSKRRSRKTAHSYTPYGEIHLTDKILLDSNGEAIHVKGEILNPDRHCHSDDDTEDMGMGSVYSPASASTDSFDDDNDGEWCTSDATPSPSPIPGAISSQTSRRGRRPYGPMDPLTKNLRKKEQNKTAAIRYRQKKKQELDAILDTEEELQKVQDELEKEKEKVEAEVRMIRSWLRDMLQARKKRSSPTSVPLSAGRLTASYLVQALNRPVQY